jgi:hypothetical protein
MSTFLGFLGLALGFVMVWKSNWLVANFGRLGWAEKYLGLDGGSRLGWKLIGIGVIILSLLYMFGFLGGLFLSIFGSIFGIQK